MVNCEAVWPGGKVLRRQQSCLSSLPESTNRGDNHLSKYVTQAQQQRPESPTVTLAWHACKYKVHKLHQRYILIFFFFFPLLPVLMQEYFW